jgi:hypothetical protein
MLLSDTHEDIKRLALPSRRDYPSSPPCATTDGVGSSGTGNGRAVVRESRTDPIPAGPFGGSGERVRFRYKGITVISPAAIRRGGRQTAGWPTECPAVGGRGRATGRGPSRPPNRSLVRNGTLECLLCRCTLLPSLTELRTIDRWEQATPQRSFAPGENVSGVVSTGGPIRANRWTPGQRTSPARAVPATSYAVSSVGPSTTRSSTVTVPRPPSSDLGVSVTGPFGTRGHLRTGAEHLIGDLDLSGVVHPLTSRGPSGGDDPSRSDRGGFSWGGTRRVTPRSRHRSSDPRPRRRRGGRAVAWKRIRPDVC